MPAEEERYASVAPLLPATQYIPVVCILASGIEIFFHCASDPTNKEYA
jgi:hypothetical protein